MLYNKIEIDISKSYLKYESEEDRDMLSSRKDDRAGIWNDVINDLEGNDVNTIVKRKIAMRAGETDIAKQSTIRS